MCTTLFTESGEGRIQNSNLKQNSCLRLSMQTQTTGVGSSNPTRVTIRTPLVTKAIGNHLIKSTSLEKFRALSLASATLQIEYATQLNFKAKIEIPVPENCRLPYHKPKNRIRSTWKRRSFCKGKFLQLMNSCLSSLLHQPVNGT